MAQAKRATPQRTIIQLERSAHVLSRMHEELRALPASSRTTRLIERNEAARAKIAEKLGTLRGDFPFQRPAGVK